MGSHRFNPAVLHPDPERRGPILAVLEAALTAVDPAQAVSRALTHSGSHLIAGAGTYNLEHFQRVFVVGFGKAAVPMARAAAQVLGSRLSGGLLITKEGHGPAAGELPTALLCVEAGHPLPNAAGVEATRRLCELAGAFTADDLVLCLVSGGGSALLTLPAEGLTLADLQATTHALLRSGANIQELNALRKHLSQVKGGQLARLAAPATLVSLVLSDVVGSPLDVIASGPTVPDPTSWADAWAVVQRYRLASQLPPAVVERLQAGLGGALPDTPKPDDPIFASTLTLIVGDNALAAAAAAAQADRLGFHSQVLTTFLEGEAREVARMAVALGREVRAHRRPIPPPACLILGGETTVTLRGQGKGGRNQELALAAGLQLQQIPEGGQIVLAALATDGTDGPTDSAGGLADCTTVQRGAACGLNAAQHLADNNAYPFLQAVGDLLVSGPTQTNVNDLIMVFVY